MARHRHRCPSATCKKCRNTVTSFVAVAEGYFKLLAYKDEYEVARLHAETLEGELAEAFDGVKRVTIGPGIGCPVIASLTGADLALIVTEPTVSGVHDMKRVAELAAGHGHEQPARPVDDLEVANNEGVIDGNRAEGPQAVLGILHQLDANLGDLHSPTLPNR